MSNSSARQKNGTRVRRKHTLAVAQIRPTARDLHDELASLNCNDRALRYARLREEIETAVTERQLRKYVIHSAERRTNCILLFAALMMIAQQWLPGFHPQPETLVPLLLLAGWAIRSTGGSVRTQLARKLR